MSGILSARVRALEKISVLIKMTEMRLSYLREPVGEMIKYLSDCVELSELSFLARCRELYADGEAFDSAWNSAVRNGNLSPPLNEGDVGLLAMTGSAIGASDMDGQLGTLGMYESMFAERLAQARKQEAMYGRLYMCLGISLGIAAALIII